MNNMKDMSSQANNPHVPDVAKPKAQAPVAGGGATSGAAAKLEGPDSKKIVGALLVALEHKFGRKPTPQELGEALMQEQADPAQLEKDEQEQTEQEGLPKILSYKVYYGMKQSPEGQREPDPEKALFYENHGGSSWFDVDNSAWLSEKPPIVDHLPCRTLGDSDNQRDLFDAIINGVMDDDDFTKLQSRQGMLDNRCERAWELTKQAKDQFEKIQAMEKSLAPPPDQDPLATESQGQSEGPRNNISMILSGVGIQSDDSVSQEPDVVAGAGGAQVMGESAIGPGVEARIRKWVDSVIAGKMDEIVDRVLMELDRMAPDGMDKSDTPSDFDVAQPPTPVTGTN